MSIVMAGIDYKTAGVEVRERFSLTAAAVEETAARIREMPGVGGCVLLSTCNRTELYLSPAPEGEEPHPGKLLCGALGLWYADYESNIVLRRDRRAVKHLMMVSCGLRSQIRGEDQILAQVKRAITGARNARACDAVLETLFRCAVTAGKKAKAEVPLSPVESSVARRALEVLREHEGDLRERRALVIGNGEMGRLAASLLMEAGCAVTMTVRSYKRGEVQLPQGCESIPYDERYRGMERADILVSATVSPHHTVQATRLAQLSSVPGCFVDLAVPRDIDPMVADLPGVRCWNVDTLGGGSYGEVDAGKYRQIAGIQEEYIRRFYEWHAYSELLPAIGEISEITADRVEHALLSGEGLFPGAGQGEAKRLVRQSVHRTVELLLLGLKDSIDLNDLAQCRERLNLSRGGGMENRA